TSWQLPLLQSDQLSEGWVSGCSVPTCWAAAVARRVRPAARTRFIAAALEMNVGKECMSRVLGNGSAVQGLWVMGVREERRVDRDGRRASSYNGRRWDEAALTVLASGQRPFSLGYHIGKGHKEPLPRD